MQFILICNFNSRTF